MNTIKNTIVGMLILASLIHPRGQRLVKSVIIFAKRIYSNREVQGYVNDIKREIPNVERELHETLRGE